MARNDQAEKANNEEYQNAPSSKHYESSVLNATDHATTNNHLAVKFARVYPELSNLFRNARGGWSGGDGAYSIPLNRSTTLWTFGDSWVGAIKNNERPPDCVMVNNTIGVQKVDRRGPLSAIKFKHLKAESKPVATWTPVERDCYFWPGDGIALDGKLFVFLHKITTDKSIQEPFQFRTLSDTLAKVDSPLLTRQCWKTTYADLGNDGQQFEYGTATIYDGKFLYIYCSNRARAKGIAAHPASLCRLSKSDLTNMNIENIEYLHKLQVSADNATHSSWGKGVEQAAVLFADAAPEMSVTRVKGIPGFIAVYMPPLSKEIYIRHAKAPEGPWSERIKIYDCPEKEDGILLYSAKAHQELASEPGELIVTYCRNSKDNKLHYEDASIYFPQAIRIKLKAQL